MPHTIVLRNSRPNSWLFTNGGVLHFTYENSDLDPGQLVKEIYQAASSCPGAERGGPDELSIVAQMLTIEGTNEEDEGGGGAVAPAQIRFMTMSEVERFLMKDVLKENRTCVLQVFMPPAGERNHTIRATYTAHAGVKLQQRTCRTKWLNKVKP